MELDLVVSSYYKVRVLDQNDLDALECNQRTWMHFFLIAFGNLK